MKIDVRGDLAGILAISLKTKTPATGTGVSQVEMVAGTRNIRSWRNETSVPGIGVLQESMVAGTRDTRFLRLVERAIAKLTS